MKTQKFQIATNQSKIDWLGRKVTGTHNGTIDLKKGELQIEEGLLIGGSFTIDMRSIKILDVTDPATNAQFAGHLDSDDFFSTEQHPEAVYTITKVDGQHVEGDLTVKGITAPVGFDVALKVEGNTLTATGKIVIDRTRYGIRFRSGNFFKDLGDTLIYNDFDLDFSITAKAA